MIALECELLVDVDAFRKPIILCNEDAHQTAGMCDSKRRLTRERKRKEQTEHARFCKINDGDPDTFVASVRQRSPHENARLTGKESPLL